MADGVEGVLRARVVALVRVDEQGQLPVALLHLASLAIVGQANDRVGVRLLLSEFRRLERTVQKMTAVKAASPT